MHCGQQEAQFPRREEEEQLRVSLGPDESAAAAGMDEEKHDLSSGVSSQHMP